ncbi:oxidoreductase [Thiospirillum jenense]|uniref:hydrogenase (acceptor) n=1 Tax=Thiospirillum jenense TaxID=1653858 RepID=A0A839HDG2_9GAMM|nr:oxidoreductase [Thiospirillum jenense]MBB1126975.1 oxidoreductase [Thiospirillum jenense]
MNSKRRQFIQRLWQIIVAAGAAQLFNFEELLAAPTAVNRPRLLWLHGTSCSGCSTAFLDIEQVSIVEILTQFVDVIFHPDLSLATGEQVIHILDHLTHHEDGFILVLEGGIPIKYPHACLMGERPMTDWITQLAPRASMLIAAGTCAALGGIPKMNGTVTGSMTLREFLQYKNINKPLVALPNCPMKPEHIVYVLLHQLKLGQLPELDELARPIKFFERTIHERCIYYADFQERRYAERIGDPGCLLKLGCQGPVTHNDCMRFGHNHNTNTCIRSGHPCIGCASERFPRQIMLHRYGDRRAIHNEFDA